MLFLFMQYVMGAGCPVDIRLAQIVAFTNSSQKISTRLLTVLTKRVILQLEQRKRDKEIRRLKKISNSKELKKHFWQIHGEIRKPATIMLGLDHYCGEIGKIDQYTKGGV